MDLLPLRASVPRLSGTLGILLSVEESRGARHVVGETAWMALANCAGVDPDLFFPERGESTASAKDVCRGCVVRTECLEYALINGEKFGIWGGLSERERRRIRRSRSQGWVVNGY